MRKDIPFIGALGGEPVQWRWYQNGYDHEPTDAGGEASPSRTTSAITTARNISAISPTIRPKQTNLRGEGDFFSDMAKNVLPRTGGVFYIRGGYYNLKYPQAVRRHPESELPQQERPHRCRARGDQDVAKSGDDDHPSYSDSQLTEAMAARVINAIAANKDIWEHSAIVITYDESDGLYDHVPPRILSYGPDGLPIARGIRIPLLLISPYARVHAVSHAEGDHNAVIETINALFGLPALSSLPGRKGGARRRRFAQVQRLRAARLRAEISGAARRELAHDRSLLSGFDKARVTGALPPLPASYAMIPSADIDTFPHYGGKGCAAIGVTPEDVRQGIPNVIPDGFNSLPVDPAGVQLSRALADYTHWSILGDARLGLALRRSLDVMLRRCLHDEVWG